MLIMNTRHESERDWMKQNKTQSTTCVQIIMNHNQSHPLFIVVCRIHFVEVNPIKIECGKFSGGNNNIRGAGDCVVTTDRDDKSLYVCLSVLHTFETIE